MPQNILDKIVETKRDELKEAKKSQNLIDVAAQARRSTPPRDMFAALSGPASHGIHLIAEIKKASPSAGLIREDFDPPAIAEIYNQAGASALSVLTDRTYFQGDLDFVRQVREVVPLPVLRKDFLIDPYQVYEARAAGADAILLIAEVLNLVEMTHMLTLSDSLGMTTLIESHSPQRLVEVRNLVKGLLPRRVLLGINNRDLKKQVTDISTTESISGTLDDSSILVAESGIKTRSDVERMQAAGARAILVGETLMASEDIGAKVRELLPA